MIANIASGVVAIEFQAKSVNFGVVSACASGSHALGEAMRHIRDGHADIMLSGGSEACITRLSYAGFCNMKAMSTDFNDTPEKASRPFDKLRDGFVMGEGAGVLVIESLEHAKPAVPASIANSRVTVPPATPTTSPAKIRKGRASRSA